MRMKAVVFDRYGSADVLRVDDVPRPVPGDGEVLVRIRASTVSAEDPKMRRFDHPPLLWLPIGLLFGFFRPRKRILGMELSGVVEAVGGRVTRFEVGDEVFGYTGIGLGAHAEYKCIPEQGILTHKPPEISHEEAAAASNGALTALAYLRNMAGLARGERLLVYGASGAVGTAAVQLGKHFGADVTGVCGPKNQELVRSLGADRVIDYTKERFTEDSRGYDIVFDTVGKTTFSEVRAVLRPRGRYLVTVFGLRELVQMAWTRVAGGLRVIAGASNFHWTRPDLDRLAGLMKAGELRSVVDRSYPLSEAAEAHRYVEQGHKRGNVVLVHS